MSVAILTPLPPIFDETTRQILREHWRSLDAQDYPQKQIHYFFTTRPQRLKDYKKFLKEEFKHPYKLLVGPSRPELTELKQLTCKKSISKWELERIYFNLKVEQQACYNEFAAHRNLLLNQGKNFNFGFFVDSDVILPANAISTLTGEKRDLIGGVVTIRLGKEASFGSSLGLGFGKIFYDSSGKLLGFQFMEAPEQEDTYQVDFTNTACMMLSHRIMADGNLKFRTIHRDGRDLAEDMSFCIDAKNSGYKIYVAPKVACVHMKRFPKGIVKLWPTLRQNVAASDPLKFVFEELTKGAITEGSISGCPLPQNFKK